MISALLMFIVPVDHIPAAVHCTGSGIIDLQIVDIQQQAR